MTLHAALSGERFDFDGISCYSAGSGPPGSTRGLPWMHRLLSNPRWAQALFRGLTRPGVVHYFLACTWGS